MRLLLFVLGLLFGSFACTTAVPVLEPATPFDVARSALVTVALVDDYGGAPRPYCTGVWVSESSILTAAHCVDDRKLGDRVDYAVAKDIGNEQVTVLPAKLYAVDTAHDLALLRSDVRHGPERAVVARSVHQGERAHTMGMAMGAWWSYSQGVIAAVRNADIDDTGAKLWVQTTAPTSPGNSGGGLYNDAGELIGIAHGAYTGRAQNINWYVHPRDIAAFLGLQGAL